MARLEVFFSLVDTVPACDGVPRLASARLRRCQYTQVLRGIIVDEVIDNVYLDT